VFLFQTQSKTPGINLSTWKSTRAHLTLLARWRLHVTKFGLPWKTFEHPCTKLKGKKHEDVSRNYCCMHAILLQRFHLWWRLSKPLYGFAIFSRQKHVLLQMLRRSASVGVMTFLSSMHEPIAMVNGWIHDLPLHSVSPYWESAILLSPAIGDVTFIQSHFSKASFPFIVPSGAKPLILFSKSEGIGVVKIFPERANNGFFQVEPTVVIFHFSNSKLRIKYFYTDKLIEKH